MHIFDDWISKLIHISNTGSAEKFRNDAREYFHNLSSSNNVDESSEVKNVQRAVASSLAMLISKMEKPMSSSFQSSKVNVLNCLLGATDGINRHVGIPLKMVELLSRFYLEHCSPLQSNDVEFIPSHDTPDCDGKNEDCTVDDVRDVALSCVSSLIQTPLLSNDDGNMNRDTSIQLRISLVKKAIQRRCASVDYEEDEKIEDDSSIHDSSSVEDQATLLSGLSLLPRVKRSLCFGALQGALKGITIDIEYHLSQHISLDSKSMENLFAFTNFACSCLHGESDPRCLMQMLNLLTEIQSVFLPVCFNKALHSSKSDDHANQFPFISIFDAVAPYYPIKFTPPPNDPWGITREGLHNSLLEVMTYSTHYIASKIPDAKIDDDTNMTTLVIHLFLDRLRIEQHPYDDDQNEDTITVQDQLDAIVDLNELLLSPLDVDSPSAQQKSMSSKHTKQLQASLSLLSNDIIQEVGNILRRCHEHAAISVVSSTNHEEKGKNKKLADFCRAFASRLSYEFEVYVPAEDKAPKTTKSSLWEGFVLDSVQTLADNITSSPQSVKGRVSIAFIASLAACGGERTLRLCLDTCLPPLVEMLKNFQSLNNDEEQISTAAYGIGVFFASSRLSMEQITKNNVVIHPHPLKSYVSEVTQLICMIIVKKEASIQLKSAAVKAMESILVSSPFDIMEKEDAETIRNAVLIMAQSLIDHLNVQDINKQWTNEWGEACGRLLGTTIGRSLKKENIDSTKEINDGAKITIFEKDGDISIFVKENLLPKILSTCTQYFDSEDDIRYDWKVLAFACEVGEKHVSEEILTHLFEVLKEKNEINTLDERHIESITLVLSYILQHGGTYPRVIFHTNGFQINLINTLSRPPLKNQQDVEMSTLLLPEIRHKRRTEAEKAAELSFKVLPPLLTAYYDATPEEEIKTILSFVTDVLPPLSDWDNTRLCVILPILSVIFAGDHNFDESTLYPLLSSLIEYVLIRENHDSARTAASSCIFSIVSKHLKNKNTCLTEDIFGETLYPLILSKIKYISNNEMNLDEIAELQDVINLIGLLGSAAICSGSSLSQLGDDIARLLSLIACQESDRMITVGLFKKLDFREISQKNTIKITMIAGNAFGNLMSVEAGSPFWRQRISHIVLPTLLSSSDTSTNLEHGRLLCTCHLVCCVPLRALGEKRLLDLTSKIIHGLEACVTLSPKNTDDKNSIQDLKQVLLASLLKITNDSPQSITYHIQKVLPLIILALISADDLHETTSQLVALQILMDIATVPSFKFETTSFYHSYKNTVLTHLAQMLDHPSLQIRQAAAMLRNFWFVMNN